MRYCCLFLFMVLEAIALGELNAVTSTKKIRKLVGAICTVV